MKVFTVRFTVVTLILLLFFFSCEEKIPRTNVPNAPVNLRLQLHSYDDILKNHFAYKIFTEKDRRTSTDKFGYSGLLVVTGGDINQIYAYDLCCPYEGDKNILITPKSNGKAECEKCGSVFITIYGSFIPGLGMVGLGSAEDGPAASEGLSLRSYSVIPIQQEEYIIVN